jgi:3-hydroxyacyl-[acyl-carrier-protein] dehydratase
MKFILVDKLISLEKGAAIKTAKCLSLAEEYLADHFPAFPVLPGVLLLEGLVESATWLVRETENFTHSMILLEQARNVKYKSFLAPGSRIEYSVTAKAIDENTSKFTGFGDADGERILEARFSLRHFNLADKDSRMARVDADIIESLRQRWTLINPQ